MPATPSPKPARRRLAPLARTGMISIRANPGLRGLIDRAANAQGKTRSEFMLDAARRAAEEALIDRTLFHVEARDHARLVSLLDRPAQDNPRLRKLMRAKAPWR